MIWIIVLIVGPLALMLFADARGMFDEVGGGAFSTEQYRPAHGPTSGSRGDGTAAEREDEIRQMLQARNDRRLARGESPLDLEAEVGRLLALDPTVDPGAGTRVDGDLRDEARQLAIARNERRSRRGLEPLDLEQEIELSLEQAMAGGRAETGV